AAERARWEAQFEAERRELVRLRESVDVGARDIAHNRAPRDNDKFLRDFKKDHVQGQIARRVRNAQGRLDELEAGPGDEPLLAVKDVRVGDRVRLDALAIAPDSRLLVTGPNGAGKSTLLGLLAG